MPDSWDGFSVETSRWPTGIVRGLEFAMTPEDYQRVEGVEALVSQRPRSVSFTHPSVFETEQLRATLFGIPVHELPGEPRPTLSGWRDVFDRRLGAYVRAGERYFPDDGPGRHAVVFDDGRQRIYMHAAHIEKLRATVDGYEASVSAARSWVLWSPRLAIRVVWGAVLARRALLRTFPRLGRFVRSLDRAESRRAARKEARRG